MRAVGRGEGGGGGEGRGGRERINEKPIFKGKETRNPYAKVQNREWISMQ